MIRSALCITFLLSAGAVARAQDSKPSAPPPNTASIESVLDQVQDALTHIQKDLKGKHLPKLKSVSLTLNTVVQKQVGATFKLWVITIGGTHETDVTQEVALTLTPPTAEQPLKVAAVDLSAELESAVVSAAEGAQNVGTAEYPLVFSGLTVNLAFAVKNSGQAGASIVLLPVSVDLTGKLGKNATQTLKVVFDDSPQKP